MVFFANRTIVFAASRITDGSQPPANHFELADLEPSALAVTDVAVHVHAELLHVAGHRRERYEHRLVRLHFDPRLCPTRVLEQSRITGRLLLDELVGLGVLVIVLALFVDRGVTQHELAHAAGVDDQTIIGGFDGDYAEGSSESERHIVFSGVRVRRLESGLR